MNIQQAYQNVYNAARSINANGQTHDVVMQSLQTLAVALKLNQGLPQMVQPLTEIKAQASKVEEELKEERE